MIKARDAIASARALIGTPYAQVDCIALIRAVIRRSPGGVTDYRCEGTNWLWDSVNNSGKYQHLTQRWESLTGARAGMLAFKRYGMEDEGHVGIVTGEGTVIHSSSVNGRGVVETPLTESEGWNLLGKHRHIETAQAAETEENMESYKAKVVLDNPKSYLNVRNAPGTGRIVGTLEHGDVATVQAVTDGWAFIMQEGGAMGYVSAKYLERVEAAEEEEVISETETTTLLNELGQVAILPGRWRVADD